MMVFLSVITVTLAAIVAITAVGQYRNSRNQIRLALFEKRYSVYEKIGFFTSQVLQEGDAEHENTITFLQDTKAIPFLFANDPEVIAYCDEVYQIAIKLRSANTSMNSDAQAQLFDEFRMQSEKKESVFMKYLLLRDD